MSNESNLRWNGRPWEFIVTEGECFVVPNAWYLSATYMCMRRGTSE